MTPSLEGWPTKAKEAPSSPWGKTDLAGHQPSILMSWGKVEVQNPSSNFHKQDLIFSRIISFISFQLSSFCLVIKKLFFRVPFSAIHFCNLVACSWRFSKFSASWYLSSLFSDFRRLLRTSFLVFYLCFWCLVFFIFLSFLFFNFSKFFWNSFKLRDLFSLICFLKSFPRNLNSWSFYNRPWFSLPMHWFNKNSLLQTRNFFRGCSMKLTFQRISFV